MAKKSKKTKKASKPKKRKGPGRPPGHYKPASERRTEMLAFKVTPPEFKVIQGKLKKLAKGWPVAEFLRHAVLSCKTKVPA